MVDDQVGITRVVNLIARDLGYDVTVLNDSSRAIDTFIEFRPDVVLLDMIMPEKDGIDVLNEILLTGIPCKIVVTSGFSASYLRLAQSVAKFHNSNDISILRKPFRRDDLIAALGSGPGAKPPADLPANAAIAL
ncbi:MAG: response regulator [Acetobacteraceae bacterium]